MLGASLLLLWTFAFWVGHSAQAVAESEIEQQTASLALALSTQTQANLKRADYALVDLRDSWLNGQTMFQESVNRQKAHLKGFVLFARVLDADGFVQFGAESVDQSPSIFVRSDTLQRHREAGSDLLFVTSPNHQRVPESLAITISRPMFRRGRFAGVVELALDPLYFVHSYESVNLGRYGLVSMISDDAIVMARSLEHREYVGRRVQDVPFLAPGFADHGHFHRVSPLDGVARHYNYVRLPEFKLTVLAAVGVEESLSSLHENQNYLAAITVAVTILLLLAGFSMFREVARRESAEKALKESQSRYQGLVDSLPVGVVVHRGGKILYVNPKTVELCGAKSANEVVGTALMDWVHPDYRSIALNRIKNSLVQGINMPSYEEKFLKADGSVIDVEIQGTAITYQGEAAIQASFQDITQRRLNEQALIESENRFREIFNSVNDAIFIHDADSGRILDVNRSMCEMYGHTHAQALACGPSELSFDVPPYSASEAFDKIELAHTHGPQSFEWLARARDGSAFWTDVSLRFAHIGSQGRILAVVRDVSQRKAAEEHLQLAANVFNHAREGIMVVSVDGTIVDVNPAFTRITGYDREEVRGKNPRILKSGRHEEDFYVALWQSLLADGSWSGEVWNRRKDGVIYSESLTVGAVRDAAGAISHYVALFSDITVRKAMEDQIRQLAFHDPLTKLPNRRLFGDRLGQTLLACKRNHCFGAVLFVDLDSFKPLNDRYGHSMGDLLLVEVADRLKGCVREMDTVARFGGDEFVVLINELAAERSESLILVHSIAEKIRVALAAPYLLQDAQQATGQTTDGRAVEHVCSASIGVALLHDDETSLDNILNQADQAMYQAKEAGRNTVRVFGSRHSS